MDKRGKKTREGKNQDLRKQKDDEKDRKGITCRTELITGVTKRREGRTKKQGGRDNANNSNRRTCKIELMEKDEEER